MKRHSCCTYVGVACVSLLSGFAFAGETNPDNAQMKTVEQTALSWPPGLGDDVIYSAINDGFLRWSTAWAVDQYIAGSAQVAEKGVQSGTYLVRGSFAFARFGAKYSIPFAAAFSKAQDSYALSNLCYNDTSSGMTDCIDPSDHLDGQRAAAMQSKKILGAIALVGLAAVVYELNNQGSTHSQAETSERDDEFRRGLEAQRWHEEQARREQEEQANAEELRRERERNDAWICLLYTSPSPRD